MKPFFSGGHLIPATYNIVSSTRKKPFKNFYLFCLNREDISNLFFIKYKLDSTIHKSLDEISYKFLSILFNVFHGFIKHVVKGKAAQRYDLYHD